MKRNHKRSLFILGGVLLVAVGAVATFLLMHHMVKKSPQESERPIGAAIPSHFAFAGARGWWQGATSRDDVAVFPEAGGCFVSIQYLANETAADKETKQQAANTLLKQQGYTVTATNVTPMTIRTDSGNLQYTLHQFSTVAPSASTKIQGGQEYGYVPLPEGSLYVMGSCDTPEQLAATLPVVQAISFDTTHVAAHNKK